jgi:hypothetical protein
MKYSSVKTKLIHWDVEDFLKSPNPDAVMRTSLNVDIYKVVDAQLPIGIETKFKIFDNEEQLSSGIFYSTCVLRFDLNENPLPDLLILFKQAAKQEKEKWIEASESNLMKWLAPLWSGKREDGHLKKSNQIIEVARQKGLLA